ncbi:MAG: glycosyltransferase family 4 protein [Flavobacteriales bacterium]
MHIVFVSHEFAHPDLPDCGGIGHFLAEYCKRLVQKGHQVSVFGYSEKAFYGQYEGIDLYYRKTSMTPFHLFLERVFHKLKLSKFLIPFHAKDRINLANRVDAFCENQHVDLIELNDFFGDGAFLTTSTPKVLRTHGAYKLLHADLGFRDNKSFIFFEEKQAKLADLIISVSEFSANRFTELFDRQQDLKIVYNGVETKDILKKAFPKISRLFYFGTLSHAKGSDRLVELCNALAQTFPDMEVAIAGKPASYFEEDMLPKLSSKAQENVRFLGYLSKTEIENEIDKSSYIFFPSRLENFSVALLEAMSRGRVCIAWNIPSFVEIIKPNENGILVNSIEDTILNIKTLEENHTKRFELSEAAFDLIQNEFSKEKMVDLSLETYQDVIDLKNS